MIEIQQHRYSDGAHEHIGTVAYDKSERAERPGVIVVHAFGGISEFEVEQAKRLAEPGYVGFAIDLYGDGKRSASREEAFALMNALDSDRAELRRRMVRAYDELKSMRLVDAEKTAAIGVCFGGNAVLDLARSVSPLSAAISFHGVYDPPGEPVKRTNASVLLLHGWDDPLAPPDALSELARELTAICPDWQILAFGNTAHAFTNPAAAMPDSGMVYNDSSSSRAIRYIGWHLLQDGPSEEGIAPATVRGLA